MMMSSDEDSEDQVAFIDTLFNVAFIFMAMFALQLLLPHLKSDETAKRDGITPGRMCATLMWPDSLAIDIDLWARDPAGEVVFYKHRAGKQMDLLRDDLGNDPDPASHHFETVCSRSLAAGSWTFNAVYYASHVDGKNPDTPVSIEVSWPQSDPVLAPLKANAVLHPGEETTMVDFRIDGDGKVIRSSVNHLLSSMME